MDLFSYLLGKKAGGGVEVNLQEKEVTITSNTSTTIEPDENYDGLSQVVVITNVTPNLQSKEVTITSNTTTNISADEGYDGLSSVEVTTNINSDLYKVSSFDDMNSLTGMSEGDYCIVDLGKLPNTYEKLEYLRGYNPDDYGGTYIDTGLHINQNTIKLIAIGYYLKKELRFISGMVENGTYYGIRPHDIYNSNNTMRWTNGLNIEGVDWDNITTNYLSKHMYNLDGKKIYVDGVLKSSLTNEGDLTFTNTLPLLARNNNGTIDGWSNFDLYYALIYEGNTLVREFIPAKRKSDNVVGLYDLVNDTFYTNAGSYNFSYGESVNDEISYLFYYDGTNWVIAD